MAKRKSPMNVDIVPFWHFIVAAGISVVVLLIAIIVGATGPASKQTTERYAYGCPGQSHVWNESECPGKQLGVRGVTYTVSTQALTSTNRFWGLKVVPYNSAVSGNSKHSKNSALALDVIANVSHRNSIKDDWKRSVTNDYRKTSVQCPVSVKGSLARESGACHAFVLAFERGVSHKYYQVTFELRAPNGTAELALGDVGAHLYTGTTAYSNLEMGINIFFLIVSLCVFLVYAWMLRNYIFRGWTFEQGCTLVLTLAVIIYNNPFFSLEYLLPGMFFVIVDALAKSAFIALLLLAWLLLFDKARLGEEAFRLYDKAHTPKILLVIMCFALSAVTFCWGGIREKVDPVFGAPFSSPGVITFYVFTVIVLAFIMAYAIILGIMAVPVATASKAAFTRYCFVIVSSAVVALSIIIGAFCGNFGTNNTKSLELVYFTTLYNCYVWVLVYGYWPAGTPFLPKPRAQRDVESSGEFTEKRSVVGVDDDDEEENERAPLTF